MKAFKVNQGVTVPRTKYNPVTKKFENSDVNIESRLITELGTSMLLVATPTLPQEFVGYHWVRKLKEQGFLHEVDLLEEKKIHPHLHGDIKKKVYEILDN